jgi:hypothetical protein
MKLVALVYCLFVQLILYAQAKDVLARSADTVAVKPKTDSVGKNSTPKKPEIFTNGFIDVLNNGQIGASARLIRLFIGEPQKFAVPLSIYSGVSNNFQNFQSYFGPVTNETLVNNFINPLSGLVNISIEGVWFQRAKKNKITKPGMLYHVGERVLTGYRVGDYSDPMAGKAINFLNSFASLGFYFQTGAWERSNAKNTGVFWLALRYIGCYTQEKQLQEIIPDISTNGRYWGYSIGGGVEINSLVNLKILYYKYTKKPEMDYVLPIYQMSFNYSFKN